MMCFDERSAREVGVTELEQKRPCATCSRPWDADVFYANCGECKDCKRKRSRNNRAVQARKLAAFERFVDALVHLADRPTEPVERGASLTSEVG
jgi:hypothetical protein